MKKIGVIVLIAALLLPSLPLSADLDIKTVVHEVSNVDVTARCNGRKLAVDNNGKIYVCYQHYDTVCYTYSTDEGSTWIPNMIASGDDVSGYPAMALDKSAVKIYIVTAPNKVWFDDRIYEFTDMPSELSFEGHPSITVNPEEGYGIFYAADSVKRLHAQLFHLDCMNVPTGWKDVEHAETYQLPSCCWSGVDAVCGASTASYVDDNKPIVRRVDYKPWGVSHIVDWWSTEEQSSQYNHGYPSLTRKETNVVWAVYWEKPPPGQSGRICYKYAEPPMYEFEPSNGGFEIASSDYGGKGNSGRHNKAVQIAENYPFVVWERVTGSGLDVVRKIWYSYRKPMVGSVPQWSDPPERATDYDDSIQERDPHVAIDWKNQKVRIIWTQQDRSNRSIKMRSIDFTDICLDTLIVTRPAGGETWYRGTTEKIKWLRLTPNNPTCIYLYYTTNCSVENPTWYPIATLTAPNNSAEEYDWPVGKNSDGSYWRGFGSNKCKIKVVFEYDNGGGTVTAYDLSGRFTIGPGWLALWDPDNQITSYIEPNDTFDLPWEYWSLKSVDTVILQFSRDGGKTYSNVSGDLPSDSSIIDTSFSGNDTFFLWKYEDTLQWISPSTPTNAGYLKLMAIDTASDTAYSQAYGPYYVMAPGGNQYATYSNQNLMSANDDADKIGLVYTAQDPDTATKLSVIYMESDEGLDFSAPDTVGPGCWPSFSEGACFWQSAHDPAVHIPDALFYAYQLNDTFATPYPFMVIPLDADSGGFAPVGLTSVNDTVHAIIRVKLATHTGGGLEITRYYSLVTLYARFPEALPGSCVIDTLQQMTSTSAADYNIGDYATSVVKRDSVIYGAYNDAVNCCFATIVPSGNTTTTIGQGSQPSVSCSEGNITYTYLGSGDTSLIRLWRYLDDTTWVERDTFYLEDEVECLSGDRGVLYGVHYKDTSLTDVYGYSPFAEGFLLQGYYTGYYAHPFVDDEANEFSWIAAYADYADSSGYKFLHTVRRPLYVSIPAAYMESDIKRSPFTIYRDTTISYTAAVVDSGTDSLKYRIPCLDASLDYSLMLQFYHEADSAAELQVTVGSNVDTIEVPTQEFFWFHDTLPSGTDTVNLKIKRLSSSSYTFAPVCRIIVRRRSSEGVYIFSDVEEPLKPQPVPFCLYQPFPNPFSSAATIRYSLPYATHVRLKVYDVSGRLVTRLVDGKVRPGVHELRWTGKDDVNRRCASGVYFVRFTAGDYQASKKMVLIK